MFAREYLYETERVLQRIDPQQIEDLASGLADRRDGRLFILGLGGSAGHASHAVNDFRKLCGIEAYAPTDNVSELTARINDEPFDYCFSEWLKVSRLDDDDTLLIFSVGGGSVLQNISTPIVEACNEAKRVGAWIGGIVGRDGGHTAAVADACVVIPPLYQRHVTPHTEGICAVIWHCLVSHPLLQQRETKWESVR